MTSIDLTSTQQRTLSALLTLHHRDETPVEATDIAAETSRTPGTIRNQMQILTALHLVEGIPGPKGGYTPTVNAYEVLDRQQLDQPAAVPVIHEGEPIAGVTVEGIDLLNVQQPERCRAKLTLTPPASLTAFQEGDTLRIGPTPLSQLVIEGRIEDTAASDPLVSIEITAMEAPATGHPLVP